MTRVGSLLSWCLFLLKSLLELLLELAGVGAIAYTIKGLVTKEWSWSNFGKAILGGAIAGAISGGFNSLFRGGNIWDGVKVGFKNGMYNGAAQSAFMIGTFGATYKPSEKRLEYVKKMSKKYNVDYSNVKWRKGGLYQVLQPLWSNGNKRDVVWGNNVVNFNNSEQNVLGHEFGHIIQGRNQGWSNFQARGIWEQLFFSEKAYKTDGFNEWDAEKMLRNVGGRTY